MTKLLLLTTALAGLALPPQAFAQQAATATPTPPVAAAPGTAEGAKALAQSLAAYVGRPALERGMLVVTPQSSGYRIALDPKDLLSGFPGVEGKVELGPYGFDVAERPDGTWAVESRDSFTAALDLTVEGQRQTMRYDIGPGSFSGIFSPEIGSFLTGSGRYERGSIRSTEPNGGMTATMGATTYDITGTPTGDGAMDFTTRQSLFDLSETIETALDPAQPQDRVKITLTAPKIEMDGGAKRLKNRALMDLWAFAVAHPSKEAAISAQAELRTRLEAALPLWDDIDSGYSLEALSIGTPDGSVAMRRLTSRFAGDGIEADGTFTVSFGFEELSIDSKALPAWVAPLLPKRFDLRVGVTDIDLAEPARIAIADFDLARENVFSDAAGQRIASHFMTRIPRLAVEPSGFSGTGYDVTVSGDVDFSGGVPATKMTVEVKGLDTVIAALQAAGSTDQTALQAVGPLSMAKGFAKALPDGRSQWVIESGADGALSVNGFQVVVPTPVEPPIAAPAPDAAPTNENADPQQ